MKYFSKILSNQINRYYLFLLFKELAFFGAVLVPFFTEWGHISLFQVQLLQSWFMFWIFILEVPTGAVADYLGRKWSISLGALVLTLAVLTYGSLPYFGVFLFAEFLFALSVSLVSGADEAWLYDTLVSEGKEKDSKKYFGKTHSISLLGFLLATPIGSLLAQYYSLNAPMILAAIPFAISAAIATTLREPIRKDTTSESKRYLDILKNGFLYLKNHHQLRTMALDSIIVSSAAYFVLWLYQPVLQKLGIPVAMLGVFHAGFLLVQIFISSHFAQIEKLLGNWRYEKVSAVLTSIGFLTVAVYPNVATVVVFLVLAGGFGLTRHSYVSAKMNDHIPAQTRATVLSSFSMFRRLSLIALNPLVGLIATAHLSWALIAVGLLPISSLLTKTNSFRKMKTV